MELVLTVFGLIVIVVMLLIINNKLKKREKSKNKIKKVEDPKGVLSAIICLLGFSFPLIGIGGLVPVLIIAVSCLALSVIAIMNARKIEVKTIGLKSAYFGLVYPVLVILTLSFHKVI